MAINPLAQALLAGPGARYGMGLVRDPRIEGQEEFGRQAMMQGASTAPVQSPLEGLARALQAGVGGYFAHQAGQERGERERAALAELLRIGGMPQEQRQQALVGSENPDLARFAGPMLAQQAFAVPEQPSLPQGMRMGPNGPEWIPAYIEGRERLAREGAARTTINMPGEDSFQKGIGSAGAEILANERRAAADAGNLIAASARIRDALPGAITGFGADQRLAMARLGAALGLGESADAVRATEKVLVDISENVLAKTNQMKGVLTDRDIEFLRDASAGRLTFTADTIGRVAELADKAARASIERYNRTLSGVNLSPSNRAVFAPMEMPPAYGGAPPSPVAPPGATPAVPRGTPRAGDPLGILGAP